jgi:hypothetical protein
MMVQEEKEQYLENLFLQAIEQPVLRPEFLQQLIEGHIYCAGHTDQVDKGDMMEIRQLEVGAKVFIKSWDDEQFDRVVPFFTSLKKMKLAVDPQESFLCISTKIFFEMTTGIKLILNPESDAVKVFYPHEVESMLAGQFVIEAETYSYDEEVEVLLSEPEPYPEQMVQALSHFFKTQPTLKAAYLAEMFDANRDTLPVLVVGLLFDHAVASGVQQQLHENLGQIVFDCLRDDQRAIDLIHLNESDISDGLEDYLLHETSPFYLRPDPKQQKLFARLLC